MQLNRVEARVAGSLMEKQLATPQQYPLTLNALTLACNQTSNRDPVTSFEEAEIEEALASLKQHGLVRFVLPSHGRSVVRYRHVLDEKLGLDDRQLALLAVLLLRGPQTVGELRQRTDRMASFDDIEEVESDLVGLTRGETPLFARLARRPGQKEERWSELLAGPGATGADPPTATGTAAQREPQPAADSPPGEDLASLRDDVESLRDDVESLRRDVESLRRDLEGLKRDLGAG